MKTFRDFYSSLSEELHKQLQSILDTPESEHNTNRELYDSTAQKFSKFSKQVRSLIKNGEDTGLTGDKPKRGSSRAVFFPSENKQTTIDGQLAPLKTVLKIAYPGEYDKFKERDELLMGEYQNRFESDNFTRNNHGMLSEDGKGGYHTNEHGVLAPVVSNHPDHHYLEMGHVTPLKKSDFPRLTVTDSHPEGIKFSDMFNAINKEYYDAHGEKTFLPAHHTDTFHEHIMQHPFVRNLSNMMNNTGFHPGDIRLPNMGIWTHPITGKQHPVISDYGFSDDIAKQYRIRRQRQRYPVNLSSSYNFT